MKLAAILLLTIVTACGKSPAHSRSFQSNTSPSEAVTASNDAVESKSQENSIILDSQKNVASTEVIAESRPKISEPTPSAKNPNEQTDFMTTVDAEVRVAFASAESSTGKHLSQQQVNTLATDFMNIVTGAKDQNLKSMNASINNLIKNIKAENAQAQAKKQVGLIGDVVKLAQDVIKLAQDLVVAVLKLDVAGVLKVATDLIKLVIDFLI